VASESDKLGLTSAKIDLDYAFTYFLAALSVKLDAIVLQSRVILSV
jgi:hypothetical protein